MTKDTFLRELSRLLARMPADERNDVLYDYEEHIRIAMESGMSEQEAVASLGPPKTIAKDHLAEFYIHQAEERKSIGNVFRAVFATISLGFFNVIFMLGPFVAVIGVLVALFAASVAMMFSPIAALVALVVGTGTWFTNGWLTFFCLILVEGLGLLLLSLSIYLGKLFGKLLVGYAKFNARIVRGGN